MHCDRFGRRASFDFDGFELLLDGGTDDVALVSDGLEDLLGAAVFYGVGSRESGVCVWLEESIGKAVWV